MFIRNKIVPGVGGFSLIELMVTIAIVGIVVAIAVPGYLSWKPGYVVRGAVSQVRSDLNRAKMRAVETRRQCRVLFTTNGYQILDGNQIMNSNLWGNIDANGVFTAGTSFRSKNFNDFPMVTITKDDNTAIAPGEKKVSFSPRGTATLNTIRIQHPSSAGADIAVNITGRINLTWF